INVFLTIVWISLTMKFALSNVIFGFILSYLILWLINGSQNKTYFARIPRMLDFLATFIWQIVAGGVKIAWDIATPRHYMKPGIIAFPLSAKTDIEITLLANIITLTPGTMSIDVSGDRKILYVYAVYINNEQKLIDSIKNSLEKKLLEAIR
ncbi:MAG TPA: Na+/H+ antiporter subunit E, partial [Bacteroidales bacterium]|nr:Na+/H+ antiporter subunit E [Bacteroidales bacterium]